MKNILSPFSYLILLLTGFLFGTKACCGVGRGAYSFSPQVFCGNSKMINNINLTATACDDPQNYVSWFGIHATEAASKLIAQTILSGSYFDPLPSHVPTSPFTSSELRETNKYYTWLWLCEERE